MGTVYPLKSERFKELYLLKSRPLRERQHLATLGSCKL